MEKIPIIIMAVVLLIIVLKIFEILLVLFLQKLGKERIEDKIDESLKQVKPSPPQETGNEPNLAEENVTPTTEEKLKPAEIRYVRDLSKDYLKKREHIKKYPVISPSVGKHYRFKENEATEPIYFGHVDNWAYMGDLLPDRESDEYDKNMWVPIPRNQEEAEALAKALSEKLPAIKLKPDEIAALVQPNFDRTVRMNWFQSWAWKKAKVYVYWKTILDFFTMEPQFKEVHFSLPVQAHEGAPTIFEERRELSMNYVAQEVPYAKRIARIKDALGVEITVEFTATGYCENPWYADNKFKDVFRQNDLVIRGAVTKIATRLSYLPQLKNIESIGEKFESFIGAIKAETTVPTEAGQDNKVDPDPPVAPPVKTLSEHKDRFQQDFQKDLLAEIGLKENYTGFVWTEVNILAVYPSGSDAPTIIRLENDIAEAEYKAQAQYIELAVTTAKKLADNAVENDKEVKRYKREAEGIEAAGNAEVAILNKKAAVIKQWVAELGRDNATDLLKSEKFFEALTQTGSNVILNTSGEKGAGNLPALITTNLTESFNKEKKP